MARSTHKTPQLMKLLTGSSDVTNPFLDEDFKAEVLRAEQHPEPVKQIPTEDGGTQINITSELISQWVPKVMGRFNICSCKRCTAEAMIEAYDMVKPVIIRVKSDADIKYAEKRKSEEQQNVIMQIIRMAVKRKSLPRHDSSSK